MIIAIDGPAAAGKGTLARKLAEKFDFALLDTGALYRTVGLMLLNAQQDPSDSLAAAKASADLDISLFGSPLLRGEKVAAAASEVAQVPEVRANLLKFQHNFADYPPGGKSGAVIDGRDIGTVVCPNADVKFFVTASPEVRATRRFDELNQRTGDVNYDEILAEVIARDHRDINRKDSPLVPHENAHLLDTTELDIDAVFLRAVDVINNQI